MLGWMWQRTGQTGAATTRPDVVDSWLRALTDEADKQAVSARFTQPTNFISAVLKMGCMLIQRMYETFSGLHAQRQH